MYVLHKICASEVEHRKKLKQYESCFGFFWNMAPGNVWIQKPKKCQNWAHTKNDGSMKNFFFLKRTVKHFLFFQHLAFEHTFVFRTTAFILALESCFLALFSDVFFQQWAKKSYFVHVSQSPQKKLHLRLIPKNEKVKKNFDSSFFLGGAAGNVWIQNCWEKVVFSSNFTCFSLFLRHAQWIVFFFPFFC